MKSIKFVQNGKGEVEPSAIRSTQGLTLFNANGDVNSTSTGYQIAIDTLTYIKKQITEQKFYKVAPADFVPICVGDGAFKQNILTNLSFSNSEDFESGNIQSGASGSRLASVDASVASKSAKVVNWAKQKSYSIFDIEQALQANNWDAVYAKERARKTNWDLGIQEIAFIGSRSDPAVTGLLNNPNVTINTSLITAPISGLSAANFATFVQTLISTYFTATNSTQMPTHFVLPYTDFLGLQTLTPGTVGTYPLPQIDYLLMAFKAATRNPNFKIEPLAYCEKANNLTRINVGTGKQVYALYNKDDETLRMDIPVDYTSTNPNSTNNFQFNDVAYGQYTGVSVLRNLEVLYFQY